MRTIESSEDISRIFSEGRRAGTPEMSLIAVCNDEQHGRSGRVAFIAGKKLGNAVWRNRAKRRLRAVCQELDGPFEGYDVIFLARKKVEDAPFEPMVKRASAALGKLGIKHD